MRRALPYLILGLLLFAPFVAATLGTVEAGPPLQGGDDEDVTPQSDLTTFILNTRHDLELLADEVNGELARPTGWIGPPDPDSTSSLNDLWRDMELQADEVYGENARPPEWIVGPSSPTPDRVARNLRYDLELMADAEVAFGPRERPDDWIGSLTIYTCNRSLQNLVSYLLDPEFVTLLEYDFELESIQSIFNYCGAVSNDVQTILVSENIVITDENVPLLLNNVRGDLERLADEYLGVGSETRPEGWRGTGGQYGPDSLNVNEMAGDLLIDLELLADAVFLREDRPSEWTAELGTTPGIYARDLRRNLEVLAEIALDDPARFRNLVGGRPVNWIGGEGLDDLAACLPETQGLAVLLSVYYGYDIPPITVETAGDFCAVLRLSVNNYAESDPELVDDPVLVDVPSRRVAYSEYAFTYLDTGAVQYMGMMPAGVEFEAWYRNYGDSTMMYVVGENFAVYIDREWTTLPPQVFYSLPTLDGVIPETYCFVAWCSGPGPTPTPTGQAPTPTPGGAPGGPPFGGEDLLLVPWNQVAIFYDQDVPELNVVQVRMDLCPDASLIAGCEPVLNVFDNAGNPLPIINVIGPYSVFELPYGYSNTFLITSTSYYANEVWISDPTLRGVPMTN